MRPMPVRINIEVFSAVHSTHFKRVRPLLLQQDAGNPVLGENVRSDHGVALFSLFTRQRPKTLEPERVLARRAELGSAPQRTIDSFADFARPDQTVQVAPVDDYLHLLKDPIEVLRHEIGLDAAGFERLVLPMLRRYLQWVHLLPASANHHHARLGGLAIHGLDVAAIAARAVHNSVLDYDPVFTRDLELKANRAQLWPLAAATAGLHHDLGKILIDQIITSADSGEVWNPFVTDLLTWAQQRGVTRYAVRWRPGDRLHRHESFGLLLMGFIAGPDIMSALSSLGRDVLEAVVMSVSGERDDAAGLREMVHNADVASSRLDRDSGSAYWSEGNSNVDPIVGRLLDAAVTLIRRRSWKVNSHGHPIWVTRDGAYLLWPQAFNSMREELLSQQKAVGVPNDALEVAEIFIRARIAKPRVFSNGQRVPLWALQLPRSGPAPDESNPFAALMAKVGAASNALFIPDPTSLLQGQVVSESEEVRILDDPTLPAVAMAADADLQAAEAAVSDEIPESSPVDHGIKPAEEHNGSESPQNIVSGSDQEPATIPVTDSAGALAAQASEQTTPVDEPPTANTAEAQARETLLKFGEFGRVLERIADKIALEPGQYQARERITMKGDVLVLRWPDAVKGEVKDLRELADELAKHPDWLVSSFAGQAIDPATNGITVSTRIRGSNWNAVPVSIALSAAFNLLARRNTTPSNDIP